MLTVEQKHRYDQKRGAEDRMSRYDKLPLGKWRLLAQQYQHVAVENCFLQGKTIAQAELKLKCLKKARFYA